jgi:type IV pilus assembly protein PilM
MKLFNRFALQGKKNRIGVDIGSCSVKAIELSGERDNLKIKNLAYVKVEDPDSKDSFVQAVKESAARANILNKEVNIAVSGPSVIVRFIELPYMNKEELRNAITFEAEKYIPFNINEVIIEYQLLIPRLGDENKMLVLLVAAKKDIINQRLALLKESGLSARVLDLASFANVNAFLARAKRKKDEIVALIDIGAKATDINIVDGDILYFARSIQLGGNDVTKVLSDALSVDLKKAEDIKVNPADKTPEVSEKIEPVLHNIIDEIRLSFSYYENQSGKSIQKVYLTGGSAKIINFYGMLKDNLGVDIVPWDPAEGMELDPAVDNKLVDSIKDQLGVAIGLALR